MKKFIALAIAVVMLAALAVPAFAENTASDQTTVTYTIGETYTFVVDDAITLNPETAVGAEAGTINLTVSNFNINASKTLTITATATGLDGENQLTLEGADENNDEVAVVKFDANVATFAADAAVLAKTFTATWVTKPEAADVYTDTITFTAGLSA